MAAFDPATLERWRALAIVDRDGTTVGTISEFYLDRETGYPTWALVETGLFGATQTFVPLVHATEIEDGLQVPYDKRHIKDSPRVDLHDELTPDEEATLFAHYGVDYEPSDIPPEGAAVPEEPGTTENPDPAPEVPGTTEAPGPVPEEPGTTENPESAQNPETAPEASTTAENPSATPGNPGSPEGPASAPVGIADPTVGVSEHPASMGSEHSARGGGEPVAMGREGSARWADGEPVTLGSEGSTQGSTGEPPPIGSDEAARGASGEPVATGNSGEPVVGNEDSALRASGEPAPMGGEGSTLGASGDPLAIRNEESAHEASGGATLMESGEPRVPVAGTEEPGTVSGELGTAEGPGRVSPEAGTGGPDDATLIAPGGFGGPPNHPEDSPDPDLSRTAPVEPGLPGSTAASPGPVPTTVEKDGDDPGTSHTGDALRDQDEPQWATPAGSFDEPDPAERATGSSDRWREAKLAAERERVARAAAAQPEERSPLERARRRLERLVGVGQDHSDDDISSADREEAERARRARLGFDEDDPRLR